MLSVYCDILNTFNIKPEKNFLKKTINEIGCALTRQKMLI